MQPRHRCQTVGFGICICWSKTIQFREHQFLIPILQLSHGHRLWSLHAYERHILEFPVSQPSLLSCITEKITTFPLHTLHSPTNCRRFSVTQASQPTNSRATVFTVVELPTPSVAVLLWNLSVSKGTGLRTLFCFASHNHLSSGSQW